MRAPPPPRSRARSRRPRERATPPRARPESHRAAPRLRRAGRPRHRRARSTRARGSAMTRGALAPSPSPWHNPAALQSRGELDGLNTRIVRCRRCPRLVLHREAVAASPPRRHRGERYWARPLPGFGDPRARLLLVGLAPAAHGGNRTGRMFTGDQSGTWLFEALHHAGFASQPTSEHADDGLTLRDAYVTATIRCAPPLNKPAPDEALACRPYLLQELKLL